MQRYPAVYHDRYGLVKTKIENYGDKIQVSINGVNFEGTSFDKLRSEIETPSDLLAPFTFRDGYLFGFSLFYKREISLYNYFVETTREEFVDIKVVVGKEKNGKLYNAVHIALVLDDELYRTKHNNERFELAFRDLVALLPSEYHLKCCIGCEFASFHPSERDFFGSLICFKSNPKAIKMAVNSDDIKTLIYTDSGSIVQETHLCDKYESREHIQFIS